MQSPQTLPEPRSGLWLARYVPTPSLGPGEARAEFLCPACGLRQPKDPPESPAFKPVRTWLKEHKFWCDIGHYGCSRCDTHFLGQFPQGLIFRTPIMDMIEVAAKVIKTERPDAVRFMVKVGGRLFRGLSRELIALNPHGGLSANYSPAPVSGGRADWHYNSESGPVRVYEDKGPYTHFEIEGLDSKGWSADQ